MINIRNKTGAITTDSLPITKIIREYLKQLYTHKSENLDKIDPFHEKHRLSKPTQYETEFK